MKASGVVFGVALAMASSMIDGFVTQSTATSFSSPIQSALQAQTNSHDRSRRDALMAASTSLLAIVFASATPHKANAAAVVGGATQIAKVAVWPGIEGLEPMYELKLSLDAMTAAVSDPKNWPSIQKRLERFFKGAIFSEKNFYFGVGLQYMNDIQYTPGELPNYVIMDKEARYDALDRTMKNMEALKSVLGEGDAAAIEGYAQDTKAALASWFAMVPESDVRAVEQLFLDVKKADVNRDGRLSDDELATLSIQEQELWKKRVDKFG